MKTKILFNKFLILYLFAPFVGFMQGRLILNDNVFVLITNNAKIVVDNQNTNAVATTGTGGNLISEGQQNQLVWNIKNGTGVYTIPWTTKPVVQGGNGVKIPLQMNITSAGDVGGEFNFSTYETATDMNTAYPTFPTAVTDMYSNNLGGDGALYVVDRFWILDNTSYASIPDATLAFTYDDNANEISGANLLAEANLRAQRWNITATAWESLLFGATNVATNVTSGVVAPAATFWPVWVLVDETYPLPILLKSQQVENNNCENIITWEVFQEINCSHYVVNRSYDGLSWEQIATVEGAGNSTTLKTYSIRDDSFENNGIIYYKINQYDFDGKSSEFEAISVNAFCTKNDQPIIFPNPTSDLIQIKSNYNGNLMLYDAAGRLIEEIEINTISNVLDLTTYASGMYNLQLNLENENYYFKIIKK
jgi:hypothetical protein